MRKVAVAAFVLGLVSYLVAASHAYGQRAVLRGLLLASESLSVHVFNESRAEFVEGVQVRVSTSRGELDLVTDEHGLTHWTNVPLDEPTTIHICETVTESGVIAGSCFQVENASRAAVADAELDMLVHRVSASVHLLDPVDFSGVFPNNAPAAVTATGRQHFFLQPPFGLAWQVQAEVGDASTFAGHIGGLPTRADVDSLLTYHGLPTGDYLGALVLRCEEGETDRHGFLVTAELLGSRHSVALDIEVLEPHGDSSTLDRSHLDVRSLDARSPSGTEDKTYATVLLQGEFHEGYTVILFKPREIGPNNATVREVVSQAPVLLPVAATRNAK